MNKTLIYRWFALWAVILGLNAAEYSVVEIQRYPAVATDINNQGVVVGYSQDGGFLYDSTGFRPTRPKARLLGEVSAVPWEPGVTFPYELLQLEWHGINGAGQLVGSAVLSNKWMAVAPMVDTARYPIVWDGTSGEATALDLHDGAALSINAAGIVVGNGSGSAYRLTDGTNITLLAPTELTAANAINDSGIIAGAKQFEAATFLNGVTTVLNVIGTGGKPWLFGISAVAINSAGQVVGNIAYTPPVGNGGWSRGFLWSNGSTVLLESTAGAFATARDVNDAGVVVGRTQVADGTYHAFTYRQGQMIDLNTLIPVAGWVLTEARALNNLGQIVGTGLHNGQPRAFLLNPVDPVGPVPPSIVQQPVGGQLALGGSITLTVSANGTPPFTYQWRRNSDDLEGETTPTLTLTGVDAKDSATYRALVRNSAGEAYSDGAVVTVLDPEISVARYAGLTINGAVGGRYEVQGASLLLPDQWFRVAQLTLTNSTQLWFDLESGTNPIPRYYRAVRELH